MSEGGKLYNAIKETADASGVFDNLRKSLPKVRSAGIQVFIVPHHRSRPHEFDNWQHINMFQRDLIVAWCEVGQAHLRPWPGFRRETPG
jgi:hypothetical protein